MCKSTFSCPHIKKSTRGGNAKPAGDAIQQLIKKELHVERVEMENYEEDVKPFVNRLKDLRDRLSHGRSYTLKEKDNERIMKLKEIVQELLLKELGFNLAPQTYDFEAPPKASIRNVKESIKQLREKEQRQIKNGGYLLSFEEEKEQIEKMEEEQ